MFGPLHRKGQLPPTTRVTRHMAQMLLDSFQQCTPKNKSDRAAASSKGQGSPGLTQIRGVVTKPKVAPAPAWARGHVDMSVSSDASEVERRAGKVTEKATQGSPKGAPSVCTVEDTRICLEEAHLIEQEDALDLKTLAGALVQISLYLGLPQATRDAVHAVALLTAQAAHDDVGELAADRIAVGVASKLIDTVKATVLTKEQVEVTVREAVHRGLQEGLRATLLEAEVKLPAIAEETVSKMKQAIQGMIEMTAKFTESSMMYWDALVRSPPRSSGMEPCFMQLGPRLWAREGMRARQVLIDLDRAEEASALRDNNVSEICDKANKALAASCAMQDTLEHHIKAITKLCNGGILLELNSNAAVVWSLDGET